MDESGRQPAYEVDPDPAIVASPTNSTIKGKRGAKEVVETEVVGSKKQKMVNGDVEQAIFKTETQEKTKEEQTSSLKEHCSFQSEEEQHEENDKVFSQPKDVPSAAVKSGSIDEEEVEVPPTKKSATTTQEVKKANESEEKDGDDNSKEDQHLETPKKSDTDVEMFDASSVKKMPQTQITSQATGSKTLLMSNLSFMIREEDVKIFFKNVGEIAKVHFDMKEDYFTGQGHVEFTTAEAAQEALKLNNELLLDHPVRLDLARERDGNPTTTPHATGPKTLFIGNLSFSIEEDDVRDFFKDVGEIAEIRFAIRDDIFLGYGHIEFTTAEAAQEALKLNNKLILDRHVKLDLARDRAAYTPGSSMEKSNQKGWQDHRKTLFVRGFDCSDGFDNIRSALETHFGKCGVISRISIPKDYESRAPKGVAFIDFLDRNGFSQALELDGSEVGGSMITVQEAKNQRADSREGSGHGVRGWDGGNGSGGGWGGVTGSGGGRGGASGFRGGRGGESGTGGRWASGRDRESFSGGGWGRESGTGGRWASGQDRESGSGGARNRESGYGGAWNRESGYRGGRDRECGSGGGWGRESSYGRGSAGGRERGNCYVGGRGRESGPSGGWGRESGPGGGWGGGQGRESGYGGGREGGWSRGSGSGGGRGFSNSIRGGRQPW